CGGATLQPVRDDRLHARIGGCFGDDRFCARRDAEQPNAMDTAAGEVGDGAVHVAVPLPAEGILVPSALAASACVVQEHAVARFCQHACVADRSLAVAAAA